MMKRGFALTLMTVAIALAQVSTSHATAPVIADPGDVIIGDLEDRTGTTPNIFVAPDMINADAIVSDDTTPDAQIKWSFTSGTTDIEINGVGRLDPSLSGLGDDDPTSPRASSRIDLVNDDTGTVADPEDSNPRTFTFRDVANNPGPGPAGVIDVNTVTLFASDCSTFGRRSISVWTIRGESDGLSGAGPQVITTVDFTQTTDGWIGGNSAGFGGTVASGASGLCMTVPAAGNNDVLWVSPDGYVDLVDTGVYRSRITATSSQAAIDAIPLFLFVWDNQTLTPNADGTTYGGFSWLLDVDGNAQGIGRNGDNSFDFWWSVNAGATGQFQAAAFTPAADAVNDARNWVRVLDANTNLLSQNDSGTICVQTLEIALILRDNIQATTVFNPPIDSTTHAFVVAAGTTATTSIDNVNDEADIDLGVTGDNRVDFGYFNPSLPAGNQQFAPIVWTGDTVYRSRSAIRASAAGSDPVETIFIPFSAPNAEIGTQSFTTRGPGGVGSVLSLAASPTTTSAEYEAYFYSHNATNSVVPDANRLSSAPFFFNFGGLFGGGTGGDPFEVESLEVDILN